MARQIDAELTGRVDSLILYESSGDFLIRTVQQQTAATRLAAKKFGEASSVAKRLRGVLAALITSPRDRRMQNRLTVAMRRFLATRKTEAAIDPYDNSLAGFSFNADSPLSACLLFPFNISAPVNGKISVEMPAIIPLEAIHAPQGTTKVELGLMAAAIDPEDDYSFAGPPQVLSIPYNSEQRPAAVLEPECLTERGSMVLLAVSVTYFKGSKKIAQSGFMPVEILAAWADIQ